MLWVLHSFSGTRAAGPRQTFTANIFTDALDAAPNNGVCALFDPLADNGGFTFTHALQAASPAINTGNDIKNTKVTISYTGTGGKLWVDDVSLKWNNLTSFENGLIPLPGPMRSLNTGLSLSSPPDPLSKSL